MFTCVMANKDFIVVNLTYSPKVDICVFTLKFEEIKGKYDILHCLEKHFY